MLNRCIFMGRLAADHELRKTGRGTAEFIARNFRKGQPMVIETKAQSRTYERDGQNHAVVEFVVDNAYFAGGKQAEQTVPGGYECGEYGDAADEWRPPWEV